MGLLHRIVRNPTLSPTMAFPDVDGWSGELVQQLLYELACAAPGIGGNYAEVGTYYGKTLLAAAQSKTPCLAIDDFSQTGLGTRVQPELLHTILARNIMEHAGSTDVMFIRQPWEYAFDVYRSHIKANHPIGVFFYDGDHAREPTKACLRRVQEFLVPGAVVVVDDVSGHGVLEAVADVFHEEPRYHWLEVLDNFRPGNPLGAQGGWWNGLAVMGWEP